jgi:hypothetical protein
MFHHGVDAKSVFRQLQAASTALTSTRVPLPPCPTCGGAMVAVERLTIRQLAVQAFIDRLALDSS